MEVCIRRTCMFVPTNNEASSAGTCCLKRNLEIKISWKHLHQPIISRGHREWKQWQWANIRYLKAILAQFWGQHARLSCTVYIYSFMADMPWHAIQLFFKKWVRLFLLTTSIRLSLLNVLRAKWPIKTLCNDFNIILITCDGLVHLSYLLFPSRP